MLNLVLMLKIALANILRKITCAKIIPARHVHLHVTSCDTMYVVVQLFWEKHCHKCNMQTSRAQAS